MSLDRKQRDLLKRLGPEMGKLSPELVEYFKRKGIDVITPEYIGIPRRYMEYQEDLSYSPIMPLHETH